MFALGFIENDYHPFPNEWSFSFHLGISVESVYYIPTVEVVLALILD